MSSFIPHLHSDLRTARETRRGATATPESVPRGVHKTYPRMEQIKLPSPEKLSLSLTEALEQRTSHLGVGKSGVLSMDILSTLLGNALKKRDSSLHRNYPSGGGLYPIETYIITNTLNESIPSVFHYNPTLHVLEKLWAIPEEIPLKELIVQKDIPPFSTIIIFTSVWKRSSAKYGDFTYMLALLEAGHMSENLLLVSTALGLHSRPVAGFDDSMINKLLDLDPLLEQPIYSVIIS